MVQIKDLDSRALIPAFFAETVEFPGLGWVPKVAICGKKVVITTFRTTLRKKSTKKAKKPESKLGNINLSFNHSIPLHQDLKKML